MTRYQRDGWHTVTPRIVVRHPAGLIAFIKEVFHAHGEYLADRPTELTIGDSRVMVSDGGGQRELSPCFLYVYVEDVEATFERAIALNALCLEEPADMPYGDRRATLRDSWGNTWQIAAPTR